MEQRQARLGHTASYRHTRLQQLATNRQRRLESETAEQRESRLQQLAMNQQERLESETAEQRESRLQQLTMNQQERLESETPEQRESRLQQLTTNQQERLESETPEQRESRLQQLATNRQRRLQSETAEERESRQQQIQREARARDSQLPLFQQQSVRSKMANFHDKIGTLQVSMCSTCSEKFPGMKVKSTGRMLECVRCSHDCHVPKLYSSSNNMHPGLVPLELQVSFSSTL